MEEPSNVGTIIFLVLLFAPYIYILVMRKKLKKFTEEIKSLRGWLQKSRSNTDNLEKKYKPIIDAESHIAEMLSHSEMLRSEVNHELAVMKTDTKEINSAARIKLSEAKEKAVSITENAHSEAKRVVNYAKQQAIDIAGDAYEAKEKADSYAAAITAMKNTINGYNDDYIVPNHSVLDDLAEEYSFKEAGQELKATRALVKSTVKLNQAGTCDYAEQNRKTYAIHFAVDAFNGKVDTALSKVKHDNYGKIKQEIIDAYSLVNHNGGAFKNARINQSYLDIRLSELKWAVATHELRQAELAEQREIKQQIREEEKAQREMAKAIKDAAKEEKMLQEALEKARAELSHANAQEREAFQVKLTDLEGQLKEAEKRGQRALSLAQQTKRGHVYVISNIGSFGEDVFKIGMTRRLEPLDRVKELGDASVPFSFDVHAMLYSENAPALEKQLHRAFSESSVNKVNPRKEFFRVALPIIKEAVMKENLTDVHWTMKAEAAEFRESLAIGNTQISPKAS